jgi:hypothetical protein
MPSSFSATWALYPNSTGRSIRPLRIGRAPLSCRLTSRVALCRACPASRVQVCATIRLVRSIVAASSSSARRNLLRIRPLMALDRARRPLRSTAAASAAVFSAMSASSPVTRRIARMLSSRASFQRSYGRGLRSPMRWGRQRVPSVPCAADAPLRKKVPRTPENSRRPSYLLSQKSNCPTTEFGCRMSAKRHRHDRAPAPAQVPLEDLTLTAGWSSVSSLPGFHRHRHERVGVLFKA